MTSNEIIIGIAIGVASTILASIVTYFFKQDIHRNIYCRLKASSIKRHKGKLIGVLVCKFEGDRRSKLSNFVRLNIKNNYTDGKKGNERLAVYSFPLSLSSVSDDNEQSKNEAIALRWLENSECDYIVWGERLEAGDQIIVKIMGRFSSATKPTTLVAYGSSGDFDQLLGEAITRELIAASTGAFEHPQKHDLASLMLIVDRTERLLTSGMERFERGTSVAIRREIDCLMSEVSRRVTRVKFLDYAVINSQHIFDALSEASGPHGRVVAAKICANHMVRRAIIGVSVSELEAYISFVEEAMSKLGPSIPRQDQIVLETLCDWLLAIQKRDVGVEERNSTFSDALLRHEEINEQVAKATSLAYLISVFPIEYMELRGISLSSAQWTKHAWQEIDLNIEDSVLAYITVDIILSESCSRAIKQADAMLFVEIMAWLDDVLTKDCDELQRLCLLSYYAELSASAIRTFGFNFYSKNFPRLEIVSKLEEVCEALLRGATVLKGAHVVEFEMVKAAANTYASIASSTVYSGNFLRADLNYQRAENLIIVKNSPGWFELLRARCVNLNNWAKFTREMRWADLSLSLLKKVQHDDIFSLYLRAFAHYTKAIIAKERSSYAGQSFGGVWLGDAIKAMQLSTECAQKLEAIHDPDARSPRQLIERMRQDFHDVDLDKFVKKV